MGKDLHKGKIKQKSHTKHCCVETEAKDSRISHCCKLPANVI